MKKEENKTEETTQDSITEPKKSHVGSGLILGLLLGFIGLCICILMTRYGTEERGQIIDGWAAGSIIPSIIMVIVVLAKIVK